MRDSGFSSNRLDGRRIGARATVIPAGGAVTANLFPSLGLPIAVLPNMISAMGSASLKFIPPVSLPTPRGVISNSKSVCYGKW